MKKTILIRSLLIAVLLFGCIAGIAVSARRGSAAGDAGDGSASESAVSSSAASAPAQSAPEAYASPVSFAAAVYSDDLMRRNAVTWAIQNDYYNEDGTPQSITSQKITDTLAAKNAAVPVKDTGDPAGLMPARTLLKITYILTDGQEFSEEEVSDETLESWSQAVRIADSEPDPDAGPSAEMIIRAMYYIDGGEHELNELEQRYPFFYQGAGFYDGINWRHLEWQHAKFSINGHEMWEAGCGFAATAMALSYLSGRIIAPVDFMENGEYTGNGAAHTVGVNSAAQYGITAHRTSDWSEVESALRDGFPVMVLETGPSMWAKTGHYILLSGLTPEGSVTVYNPGGDFHTQYSAEDYGTYTPEEIYATANPELPYTIFGR